MPRPRPPHGTNGGYLAHRRRGEDPCDECKAAHAQTSASQRHAQGATPREKGPEHGTRAAYERERRAHAAGKGPEPCDECKEAYRRWRDEQRHPDRPVCSVCRQPIERHAGTRTGWRHSVNAPEWCDSKPPTPATETDEVSNV